MFLVKKLETTRTLLVAHEGGRPKLLEWNTLQAVPEPLGTDPYCPKNESLSGAS